MGKTIAALLIVLVIFVAGLYFVGRESCEKVLPPSVGFCAVLHPGEPGASAPAKGELDPAKAIYRYTDAQGVVQAVRGLHNVPPEFRDKAKAVSGEDLQTYQEAPPPAEKPAK
ncbi:MAG: hypothetical protein AB1405_06085 [Bdellovibrionota bacterium]